MSYQWKVDARELFGERYAQMVNTGLPVGDVDAVRAAITDMWTEGPGGWGQEWSRLGSRYAAAGSHQLAALAYGWAKFPTLADEFKRAALARQLEQYQLAAPGFGVEFRREVLALPYRGGTTAVPVHLLAPFDLPADRPVVIASGGVDTWKMDVHTLLEVLATQLRVRVLAFDIAGTGESQVPMSPDGGAQIVSGLIAHARTLGNGVVGHLGISMGGYFSARSGLAGEVDAAVVLGGPAEYAFTRGGSLRFGMDGIVGNAIGFDHQPTPEELSAKFAAFSLRPLLDRDTNAPMLIVNGADDVHVPQEDTLVFQGRRDTDVQLVADTGHCAVSKFPVVIPAILDWFGRALDNATAKAKP
ncbi:alpha/beta hydrolase family protein [Streptomyces sp. CG1]|uniref:alpha/beta hydrolase family protein n=1 Tax=Streptomyces sp. CG1 TaxID=1287523 RepID=UPI0034E254A3